MVRVVQISFYTDPRARAPEALLSVWPTVVNCAECAMLGGAEVAVIQSAAGTAHLEHNGVNYHFLPCGEPQRDPGQRAHLATLLTRLAPDVLHVQGLGFPAAVKVLAALLPGVPIVLQDHADPLPPLWRRAALRQATRRVAAVAFCARELARPFVQARLLGPHVRIYEVPESSSRFVPRDRLAARQVLGRTGSPLVLWVGRLDDNKDPLTVLEGVAAAVSTLPGLELLCVYSSAPLLSAVQRHIASDARLRHRVRLLGAVTHQQVQELMQAADIFVLGSHREGSGYALIEAMACGVSPAVTDIPSFRALTGDGHIGRLWPCAEPAALTAALFDLATRDAAAERQRVCAHFQTQLSFSAVGRKLATMYADLKADASSTGLRPRATPA